MGGGRDGWMDRRMDVHTITLDYIHTERCIMHICELVKEVGVGWIFFHESGCFSIPKGVLYKAPQPPAANPSFSLPPCPHAREPTMKRCDCHRSVLTQSISSVSDVWAPQGQDHTLLSLPTDSGFFSGGKRATTLSGLLLYLFLIPRCDIV